MANHNSSRIGQINLAGNTDALFLKVFGEEVISVFEAANLYGDKTFKRRIKHGKSAQFPAIGRLKAYNHAPGTELLGSKVPHAEQIITVDGHVVADQYIEEIDELKNHYDVRGRYATLIGNALAETFDKNIASCVYKAAESAAAITGEQGGSVINGGANVASDPDLFKKAMFTAAQILDEKNVPQTERYAFLPPAVFYMAASSTPLINKDWDGDGSLSKGVIGELAGIKIVKSNHTLAGTNYDGAEIHAKYKGNYSQYAFHIFHPMAVGTVQLLDTTSTMDLMPNRIATLLTGRYVAGHGVLRPECAIAVKAA